MRTPLRVVRTEVPQVDLMADWETWQYAQSLSVRTVTERARAVNRCAEYAGNTPELLQHRQIVEWLANDQWSASTRHSYYLSLAAWFRWLTLMEHRLDNPMAKVGKPPRRPRCVPRPISDAACKRLLANPMRPRTRAMVLLAALQGLRAHEVAKLKGEDLDLEAGTMVVKGKGGVTAMLPLHPLVIEHAAVMPRSGFWFPGADRGHQRREAVCQRIKEAMTRAGVSGSAHQLRHWFGTALVDAGVDLRTVQELLRHQNLTSTAIYTAVSDKQRAEGLRRLDPLQMGTLSERDDDV